MLGLEIIAGLGQTMVITGAVLALWTLPAALRSWTTINRTLACMVLVSLTGMQLGGVAMGLLLATVPATAAGGPVRAIP